MLITLRALKGLINSTLNDTRQGCTLRERVVGTQKQESLPEQNFLCKFNVSCLGEVRCAHLPPPPPPLLYLFECWTLGSKSY